VPANDPMRGVAHFTDRTEFLEIQSIHFRDPFV
jgi:hypothetical protein